MSDDHVTNEVEAAFKSLRHALLKLDMAITSETNRDRRIALTEARRHTNMAVGELLQMPAA